MSVPNLATERTMSSIPPADLEPEVLVGGTVFRLGLIDGKEAYIDQEHQGDTNYAFLVRQNSDGATVYVNVASRARSTALPDFKALPTADPLLEAIVAGDNRFKLVPLPQGDAYIPMEADADSVAPGDVWYAKLDRLNSRHFFVNAETREKVWVLPETRPLKSRIHSMLQRYAPDRVDAMAEVIKEHGGNEADTLAALTEKYGDEPAAIRKHAGERLTAIFARYNPFKLDHVESLLDEGEGREDELVKEVLARYGDVEPPTYRERVVAIYEKYNPEKMSSVNDGMRMYAGKELQLIAALVKRYGPEPADADAPKPDLEDIRRRVVTIYEKYNPDKLETVDRGLAMYEGSEGLLLETLVRKYGPEPGNTPPESEDDLLDDALEEEDEEDDAPEKPEEQKPADEKPADVKPADEKPAADEKIAEETPAAEKPAATEEAAAASEEGVKKDEEDEAAPAIEDTTPEPPAEQSEENAAAAEEPKEGQAVAHHPPGDAADSAEAAPREPVREEAAEPEPSPPQQEPTTVVNNDTNAPAPKDEAVAAAAPEDGTSKGEGHTPRVTFGETTVTEIPPAASRDVSPSSDRPDHPVQPEQQPEPVQQPQAEVTVAETPAQAVAEQPTEQNEAAVVSEATTSPQPGSQEPVKEEPVKDQPQQAVKEVEASSQPMQQAADPHGDQEVRAVASEPTPAPAPVVPPLHLKSRDDAPTERAATPRGGTTPRSGASGTPGRSARSQYRHRVDAFYRRYCPENCSAATVDRALDMYAGEEEQLIRDLVRKYGPEPGATPADAPITPDAGEAEAASPQEPEPEPEEEEHIIQRLVATLREGEEHDRLYAAIMLRRLASAAESARELAEHPAAVAQLLLEVAGGDSVDVQRECSGAYCTLCLSDDLPTRQLPFDEAPAAPEVDTAVVAAQLHALAEHQGMDPMAATLALRRSGTQEEALLTAFCTWYRVAPPPPEEFCAAEPEPEPVARAVELRDAEEQTPDVFIADAEAAREREEEHRSLVASLSDFERRLREAYDSLEEAHRQSEGLRRENTDLTRQLEDARNDAAEALHAARDEAEAARRRAEEALQKCALERATVESEEAVAAAGARKATEEARLHSEQLRLQHAQELRGLHQQLQEVDTRKAESERHAQHLQRRLKAVEEEQHTAQQRLRDLEKQVAATVPTDEHATQSGEAAAGAIAALAEAEERSHRAGAEKEEWRLLAKRLEAELVAAERRRQELVADQQEEGDTATRVVAALRVGGRKLEARVAELEAELDTATRVPDTTALLQSMVAEREADARAADEERRAMELSLNDALATARMQRSEIQDLRGLLALHMATPRRKPDQAGPGSPLSSTRTAVTPNLRESLRKSPAKW